MPAHILLRLIMGVPLDNVFMTWLRHRDWIRLDQLTLVISSNGCSSTLSAAQALMRVAGKLTL